MDQSLEKFNRLPPAVKAGLSSNEVITAVDALEKQYQVGLSMALIKFFVGDFSVIDLNNYLVSAGVNSEGTRIITDQFLKITNRYKATPRPVVEKNNRTGFAFAAEDEEDVRQFSQVAESVQPEKDWASRAEAIIKEFGYPSADQILVKRLKDIVIAKLRDVRDDLETRDVLMKSEKIGGLAFSDEQVSRLLSIIKSELGSPRMPVAQPLNNLRSFNRFTSRPTVSQVAAPSRINLKDKIVQTANQRVASVSLAASIPAPAAAAKSTSEKGLVDQIQNLISSRGKIKDTASVSSQPKITSVTKQSKSLPVIKEEGGLPVVHFPEDDLMVRPKILAVKPESVTMSAPKAVPPKEIKQTLPPPASSPKITTENKSVPPLLPRPTPFIVSGLTPQPAKSFVPPVSRKPRLDDVRFAKKLVGPIEELGNLTLIDFRRLSGDPREAVRKIKEKIDLLEKDAYAKKLEGIRAWQSNEVNIFYRSLGQKSMTEGRSIEAIINERLSAQKPTLSLAEFEAVMELNRDLRF